MGAFLTRLFQVRRLLRDAWGLPRLLFDRARGLHRGPVWRSACALSLAILYVAIPADVVPDWIPVLGQIDDYVVIAGLIELARGEIDAYRSRAASPRE